jgi:hypothetical protein
MTETGQENIRKLYIIYQHAVTMVKTRIILFKT